MKELSDSQKQELLKPLEQLVKDFNGTVFGSIFSFIATQLKNPTQSISQLDDSKIFGNIQNSLLESFISSLRNLTDEVIENSQSKFDQINKILANSPLATIFQEILKTLKMRSTLFEYAKMGDEMLNNVGSQLSDATQAGIDNVLQPGAMTSLIPGFGETKTPTQNDVETPAPAVDILTSPSKLTRPDNMGKQINDRFLSFRMPEVSAPTNPNPRQSRRIPSFKPMSGNDGGRRDTMQV
ncbi:hypothetical protein V9T40_013649 [Parthenolecanium corni]|uniref:Uncharacterized protein n=1 Tax=Parthenolecanium corni TaxID=536013 RepID=A0AAN9Y1F9_9HEMI